MSTTPHDATDAAEPVDLTPQPGRTWCAVRTRARAEKQVQAYCLRVGVPVFLPLWRRERRYQRRRVVTTRPLFPGYVFVSLPVEGRAEIAQHRLVASLLVPEPDLEGQLLRELVDIRGLLSSGVETELIVAAQLEVGQVVEIRHGPLAGMRGIVDRRRGHARVSVNVEMIGQSVSVELDADELDAC